MTNKVEWWNDQGGFFGSQYMLGDDSVEGYIPGKIESLEERTKREVDGVIKLLNPKKTSMLDCPCGYGRHSIELAKRGYHVLGFDINNFFINKAREAIRQNFREIRKNSGSCVFLERDMRNIEEEFQFNTIINMFYSLGFFETDEENKKVLEGFYNRLWSEGKLLLHTDISPEMFSNEYKFNETRNLRNGGKLRIQEEYNPKTKRINGSWTISKNGSSKKLTPYSVRIYSKEEFKKMAKDCGFKETKFYGSFNGEEFTPKSKEMIMVAKK